MSDSLNKFVDFLVTPQAGIVQSGMLDPNKVKQLVVTTIMFVCKHAQHKTLRAHSVKMVVAWRVSSGLFICLRLIVYQDYPEAS